MALSSIIAGIAACNIIDHLFVLSASLKKRSYRTAYDVIVIILFRVS